MSSTECTSYGRKKICFDVLVNNEVCGRCIFNAEDKGLSIALNPVCAHCTRIKFYKEDHFVDKEAVKEND